MQSGSSLAIMLVPFKGIRSIIRKLCNHWKFSTKNGENNSWHFTEWSAMSHLKDGAANQILSSPRAVDVRLVADPLETELRFDHIDMTDSWVRKKKLCIYNCIWVCTCCQCDIWNRYSNYQITTLIGPYMHVVCMAWHRGSFVKNTWGLDCFRGLWHKMWHKFDGWLFFFHWNQ